MLKPECKVIYVTPKFISFLLVHCLDFNTSLLPHLRRACDAGSWLYCQVQRWLPGHVICSEVGLWFNLSDQNEFPELYLDIVADMLSSAG